MTFARNVRSARRGLHLTQMELAARLDVDKQSVSNWECGRSTPWPKERLRVLSLLLDMQEPRERVVDRILKGLDDDGQ